MGQLYNLSEEEKIQAFIRCAKQYLQLMDGLEKEVIQDIRDIAYPLTVTLAELYAAISVVQSVERTEGVEENIISALEPSECEFDWTEIWRALYHRLQAIFDKYDCYWEYFDPFDAQSSVTTLLSDDLANIYCDIKEVLNELESAKRMGLCPRIGVQYLELFQIHWGQHLVDALRVLHRLAYPIAEETDEIDTS